ncbi:hypothetical protein LUX33_37530 [Actinomadura madurae]|nr:hypothetical protein [Actinomadura madurae]MCP9953577.1 hypothetical protein [Actinomadura madurae]MCQ0005640.1 hypothetical protein [Actinomadura madurae]
MTDHIEIPTRMLVHALIREDGTVGADELYAVANTLGMSDQQMRLCIKRLVAEGRFTHHGRGRKAELRATADTTRALAPNADFLRHAFQQDAGLAPWDGVWHLAAFAVPESARTARDSLRETLVHLGGAPLQGGLYVCANAWEPYVEEAAHRLGAHGALTLLTTTDLRRGDTQEPAELARRLWPLQEIADRYHRLSRLARPRHARLTGPDELSPPRSSPSLSSWPPNSPAPWSPTRCCRLSSCLSPGPAPKPGSSSPGAGRPCMNKTAAKPARPSSSATRISPEK